MIQGYSIKEINRSGHLVMKTHHVGACGGCMELMTQGINQPCLGKQEKQLVLLWSI